MGMYNREGAVKMTKIGDDKIYRGQEKGSEKVLFHIWGNAMDWGEIYRRTKSDDVIWKAIRRERETTVHVLLVRKTNLLLWI